MRVINYVLYGAALAFTILILGLFVLVRLGLIPNPLPPNSYLFIPKAYIVQSGSMSPAIKVGSIVITQKSENYLQGDIITFKLLASDKNPTTHRIYFKDYPEGVSGPPTYLTAGDANEDIDPGRVQEGQIVGKVVFTLPYAGYLAGFAKDPKGFILLVIVPATIIIYEELKFIKREFGKSFGRFWTKFRKKKISVQFNFLPEKADKPLSKISILLPLIGAFLVVTSLSLAYFFDLETSLGNILGAATSFGEKTSKLYNTDAGFTCPAGATDLSQGPFGSVIIKKVGSTIKVDTILVGATANSTYDIWVNQDPATCPLSSPTAPGALTTDGSGNGNVHVETPYVSPATNFWISAVGGGQVLRSTAVTLP